MKHCVFHQSAIFCVVPPEGRDYINNTPPSKYKYFDVAQFFEYKTAGFIFKKHLIDETLRISSIRNFLCSPSLREELHKQHPSVKI
jgi:hypothetical protein